MSLLLILLKQNDVTTGGSVVFVRPPADCTAIGINNDGSLIYDPPCFTPTRPDTIKYEKALARLRNSTGSAPSEGHTFFKRTCSPYQVIGAQSSGEQILGTEIVLDCPTTPDLTPLQQALDAVLASTPGGGQIQPFPQRNITIIDESIAYKERLLNELNRLKQLG